MTDETPPQDEPQKKPAGSQIADLAGAVQIDTAKRLPHLDNGPIKAYHAYSEKRRDAGSMVAYACEPHLVPRQRKTLQYEAIINPNQATLIKHGIAFWPNLGRELYTYVYLDNLGAPLIPAGEKQALHLKEEIVREKIIAPLVNLLQDYRDKDFVHGSIRPSNIFTGGSSTYDRIIVGDCLSAPPSYTQPAAYETIERGMTDRIARGLGTPGDDIYSLGATAAALVRSQDPTIGLSEEDIVRMKMQQGSFAALTGRDRFAGTILDFLRGTMHDDADQRWGIEEIMAWLEGRRLNPKKTGKKYKANRPLSFGGTQYFFTSDLAFDIEKNPTELRKLVEDGELANWLTRSFEKNKTAQRVEEALALTNDGSQGKGYEERLVCNLSCAMDVDAPLRYEGRHMMPDGFGMALAEAFARRKGLEVFHDIINQGLMMNWVRGQEGKAMDISGIMMRFDSCRSFLRQDKTGFGLERCLYHINPEARCMSERFDGYYISSPETLLAAYEDLCSKKKAPGNFLDRHIVAFLMARDPKVIEGFLADVRSEEYHRVVLGQLKCLASIQRVSQIGPLPHIAAAFNEMFPALYKRFHDEDMKDKIKKTAERFVQSGDLSKLAEIFDNQEVVNKDLKAFKIAMRSYQDLTKELNRIEARLIDRAAFGRETGHEIAAVISSVIAGIIILGVAFMYISKGGGF